MKTSPLTPLSLARAAVLSALLLPAALPLHAAKLNLPDELRKSERDAAYAAASPLRVQAEDVVPLVLAGGALAATMAYDGQVRDRLVKLRRWGGADGLKDAGDVLQFGGLIAGAGLYAGGKAADDAKAVDQAWLQAEGLACASVLGGAGKYLIGRRRPGGEDPDAFHPFGSDNSFPSGHTLNAFTAAQLAAEAYPSPAVTVPAYMLAAGVGASRLAVDKHWLGDILASALLGIGLGHALHTAHERPASDWRLTAGADSLALSRRF
jgi:membrane-associated phospholipid phosphatase